MGAPMPPIPNVIQFLVRGTTPGEIWENEFFYQYSGTPPTAAAIGQLALGVANNWASFMVSLCPAPTVFANVVATDMNSSTGTQGTAQNGSAGSRGDDPIPANAAFLCSYPVGLRYRGGHFRQYLLVGGFADLQDPMNWHDAFVTEVAAHLNNFLNGVVGISSGGTTLTQHVAVRRHGKFLANAGPPHYVLNSPIVLPIAQNSLIPHKQIASQKGRIGRRSK